MLLLPWLVLGCTEPWPASNSGPDAQQPFGDAGTDAQADARVIPGDDTPYGVDSCSDPTFTLSNDSWQWPLGDTIIGGGWLASLNGPTQDSLLLFDLTSCQAYRPFSDQDDLMFGPWPIQLHPGLAGNVLVTTLRDALSNDAWAPAHSLYALQLDSMNLVELLTLQPEENIVLYASNGRQVAYALTSDWSSDCRRSAGLWLLDMEAGTNTLVTSSDVGIYWLDISDDYLVWTEWDGPSSAASSFAFMDLATETKGRIAYPQPPQVNRIDLNHVLFATSGHWVVWAARDATSDDSVPPTHLVAYDLEAGKGRILAQDPHGIQFSLDGNILIADSHENLGTDQDFYIWADLMAYDLETGLQRRLTAEPTKNYVGVHGLELPYLVLYYNDMSSAPNGGVEPRPFVANLQALGVVDGNGHLIDGAPVF